MVTKKSMIKQMMMFICGVILVSCGQAPVNTQKKPEYAVIKISTANKELQTSYSASIRGKQDIHIYPQVSGFLTKLNVKEGQNVRKGQILFVIDQVPYQAALQTAKANVEAARATVATSELTYNSKKQLFEEKVISEFDLQTSYNSLLTAKAQLAQADAQLVNAANNLSYTEVKSPSDGVVGKLPYRVGSLVSANLPQPLTTVSDNSSMYIYFSMTENQLLELTRKYGSKAKFLEEMPPITLQLNDKSIYDPKGKIETISGVIDASTGTVSLRALFPNEDELLQSGGSGNVIIPVQKQNSIVIPQKTTYELQDKVFVYKVVDGVATSTPIQVTRVNGGKEYIVNSGLNIGDVIVAEGVGLLRDGTAIEPKSTTNNQTKEG
ncbi:efflux RND transporter periplasmic adaptor subunit [Bacteroides sp. 224]|uniref:efflux RND transporter periplasmic adaptor subunit n=1 Tax=Bacteroides sp. 224 TaxID=2302936 RepID=UPI0013D145AD|nr:efflux RND transporter periplasmic adaptor subunit [Bacteroides sp. 224]NDV65355.1 efflux RND transporter periplasmic adaptor subunit [Bacteroides sp. 224]